MIYLDLLDEKDLSPVFRADVTCLSEERQLELEKILTMVTRWACERIVFPVRYLRSNADLKCGGLNEIGKEIQKKMEYLKAKKTTK